ncbi:MAG: hypothetical protein H0T65_24470 [Deltaproteobacteria bacterium]|nr:hypothetical protein [Deltaproteobacteria bacterium]
MIASCGGDGDSKVARWQKVSELRPSSLLAAWAESPDNVWIVGGREGTGGAPVVWHYDGSAWTRHDTGLLNVDLWQVFGFGDTVFFGGSNGTILRYRDGNFTKLTTPAADIVFGLWGTSATDVWAVGGQFSGRAFVWRYQGTDFTAVAGVPTELDTGGAVWKVTGRGANDVWMSASRGLVLHWDGQVLSSERIGATGETLFSIGCSSTVCVAAGSNTANGVLYENAGSGWVSAAPTADGPIWRGVTPVGEHQYVVGQFGAVLRRDAAGWKSDTPGLTDETLHAAWSDADGNLFAVGGKFDRPLTIDGVLLFKGATVLSALP